MPCSPEVEEDNTQPPAPVIRLRQRPRRDERAARLETHVLARRQVAERLGEFGRLRVQFALGVYSPQEVGEGPQRVGDGVVGARGLGPLGALEGGGGDLDAFLERLARHVFYTSRGGGVAHGFGGEGGGLGSVTLERSSVRAKREREDAGTARRPEWRAGWRPLPDGGRMVIAVAIHSEVQRHLAPVSLPHTLAPHTCLADRLTTSPRYTTLRHTATTKSFRKG